MNLKKSFFVLPLSLSLLIPAAGSVSAHGNEVHTAQSVTVKSPAADLRATLDSILSEHAYLAIITMQKGADGAKDFEASAKALMQNTEDLSNAVASVYGKEAGMQFKEIWASHIGYFVDYVKATGAKDEAAKKKALAELDAYRVKQADFLDQATGGRLKSAQLQEDLNMHVKELLSAFDSYVAGDYSTAYKSVRESIDHMYHVGKGLSWAITEQFPDTFSSTKVDTPASDLRENLNHLLSEHAGFAVLAMQKGISGAKDFEAAAGALSQNTDDLAKAIGSVYGDEAAAQFKTIWSSHIGYFVDYVKATAGKDEAAKQKAIGELDAYRAKQAKFLETATEGRLKASDLEAGLKVHVDDLLLAFNSYVKGDYNTTYPTVHTAYTHMFMVGEGLSGAIVNQFPAKFQGSMPAAMPKTGLPAPQSNVAAGSLLALALTSILAALMVRRSKAN
ncbi:copper amine oxidase [Ectobacillus ponti]|uniref:Copper amine oxidase n=1 Tax=Ectobacillus ponti TaxID=2961894 RepID=A0AA42BNU1_9BACI|nr:copper amine oxidase [Ectobacillus ponti]MCP8968067.1 copper amine oxidase [Ectobacillus ponti]